MTRRPRAPTRHPQARRGYASGFRGGRKEAPPPFFHSARPSASESTAKPEAPPPPPPPPPPPNPPAAPPAPPSAAPKPGGGGPSLTAPLVLTAGVGLAAYYFSREADAPFPFPSPSVPDAASPADAPPSNANPPDRTGAAAGPTQDAEKPLPVAGRAAAKLLLGRRDATPAADARDAAKSESDATESESETKSKSKRMAARGAGDAAAEEEVFRSAADSILAAADAAEAEARRARKREEKEKEKEKEREKERRDRDRERVRTERFASRAAKRDPPADMAGPAGAARARALAGADGDVRVQVGDALSPAALVARAFEGAVEVRARMKSARLGSGFFVRFSLRFAATLSCRGKYRAANGLFTQPYEPPVGRRPLLNLWRFSHRRVSNCSRRDDAAASVCARTTFRPLFFFSGSLRFAATLSCRGKYRAANGLFTQPYEPLAGRRPLLNLWRFPHRRSCRGTRASSPVSPKTPDDISPSSRHRPDL